MGRSIFSGYCERFHKDFVLSGVPEFDLLDYSDEELHSDASRGLHGKDVPGGESELLVIDLDAGTVSLLTSNEEHELKMYAVPPAPHMMTTMNAVATFAALQMPPDTAVVLLEDRLQELYLKAQVVADAVESRIAARNARQRPASSLTRALGSDAADAAGPLEGDAGALASDLGMDAGDMPLLLSIASVLSPKCRVGRVGAQRVVRENIRAWRA